MSSIIVPTAEILTPDQHLAVFRKPLLPKLSAQQFFDLQVAHFLARGQGTRAEYERLRQFVPEDRLDFMVRPRQPDLIDFGAWMKMIDADGKTDHSRIEAAWIKEEVLAPAVAHLMVGVDDGSARCGIRPAYQQRDIISADRSPWNIWDGICYASLFPFVLHEKGIVLVASRCQQVGWPVLRLYKVPTLRANFHEEDEGCAAPSCWKRLGIQSEASGLGYLTQSKSLN